MQCASCGYDAPAEFAFCPKCGGKLGRTCPSCGFAAPSDFGFCPKCGTGLVAAAPMARPTLPSEEERLALLDGLMPTALAEKVRQAASVGSEEGERRPVTIVFADLSGFTTLSETRDPEEVATLIDRCLRAMGECIYHYEGAVDKYIGDAVMALFGAPVAHEDDPERAIRAALELRDHIAAINRDLQGEPEGTAPLLSVHVGINTGVVRAGTVGADRRRDYTVLGDAVNVAARLEAAAGSGEVIVGESTYRLTRHAVAFEPVGELSLKGRGQPLAAYRVVGMLRQRDSGRGLESLSLTAPLVGRGDEFDQLVAAFERAWRRRTQIVSLIGEAGTGKTRLMRELLQRLAAGGRLQGATIQRAACSSLGEQTYGVLVDLFRNQYAIDVDDPPDVARVKLEEGLAASGATAEEIARAAPLLGHLLGISYGDARLQYVEPEQLKRQLFLATRDMFELRLRQGPLLLIIEDLHWADAASVELLRFILDRIGNGQLMVLVAHRPSFNPGALVSAHAAYVAIQLPPLLPDESEEILRGFFGPSVDQISPRLRQLIIERSGGNPFYLEEIIRDLVESGTIARDEAAGWVSNADLATLEVPATLQSLLLARQDRLASSVRRLGQEAAVLGPAFSESLLRAVATEPDMQEVYLDLLEEAHLIQEDRHIGPPSERRYRFVTPLAREVAYQSLLLRRRTELHERAGQALEQEYAGHPQGLEDLEALGYHFSLSANRLKGVRYLMAAGDWAQRLYANDDAARYYRWALDTVGSVEPAARGSEDLDIQERLGDVLAPSGGPQAALSHYMAALEGHAQRADKPAQARLRRKIGGLHWIAGDQALAVANCQDGLGLLEGEPEHIELAHLYQEMGRLAFRTGENEAAIRWAHQTLRTVQHLEPALATPEQQREAAEATAHAYNTLGAALARVGRTEEAVVYVERSVSVSQQHDLPQVACRAYTNLGVLYSALDPERAIVTCQTGLDLAKKIGDLGFQSWLYANMAAAYCAFTGRCTDEGIAAAQAAVDLDRGLGNLDHLAVTLIVLAQIYQCHGAPDVALRWYLEALPLAEEMGDPQLLFPCYDGLATLYLESDDVAQGEVFLAKALEVRGESGYEPDTLVLLPFLC